MKAFRATDGDAVLRAAEARGLSHVSLGCIDWDGRLRAKHYSVAALAAAFAHGLAMTTTIFAQDVADRPIELGPFEDAARGYPDGRLELDPRSARNAPYDSGGEGLLVLGDFAAPYADYCPRALLKRELARYQGSGGALRGGYELEFRLLHETPHSLAAKSATELSFAPAFERMYGLVDQAASAPFLHELEQLATCMGVPLAAVHHEFQGLVEASLAVAEGVEIADHAVLVRSAAAIVAQRSQRLACFMARVAPGLQSAGAHLNISLWLEQGRRNVFFADGEESAALRAFIAGLQQYVPELFLLFAPTVNSYKRFAPDSIAPRRNAWGVNNKTVAYRAVIDEPTDARIEIRVPGADAHPHLVLAAVLAAGRAGLEAQLTPSARCEGDATRDDAPAGPDFPRSFGAAIDMWRRSPFAIECFGEDFVDAYARSREWQLRQFESAVTDWELQTYARSV